MATSHPLRVALRSALQHQTVSITEVSANTGLDRSTLSRFLNGRADLKISTLEKVLKLFGVDLARLIQQELDPTTADTPPLLRAFEVLSPLQKKSFLKSVSQSLRHFSPEKSTRSKERETLAEQIDHLRRSLKIEGPL